MKNVENELYHLWFAARSQENFLPYIDELLEQVKLAGTETNKLTRDHVQEKLERILEGIRRLK